MIDKALAELTKRASHVTLAPEERAGIRAALAEHIVHTPVAPAQSFKRYIFNIQYGRIALGAAASAFLFVGGSISFAAEKSLPGDALYSVKTNFNESIVGFIAISDAGKAKVNTQLAEKRLNEATTLASQKRLDSKKKKVISDKLKEHVAEVETNISDIVAKKDFATAVDVSTELETTLKAHTDVLLALSSEGSADVAALAVAEAGSEQQAQNDSDTESANQVAEFAAETESAAVVATALRVEAEGALAQTVFVSPQVLAEEKRAEALLAMTSARNIVASSTSTFDEEFLVVANSSLTAAQEAFARGDVALSTQTYDEAFVEFNAAYRFALELEQKIATLVTLPVGSLIQLPSNAAPEQVEPIAPVPPVEEGSASSTPPASQDTTTSTEVQASVEAQVVAPAAQTRTQSNVFLKIR